MDTYDFQYDECYYAMKYAQFMQNVESFEEDHKEPQVEPADDESCSYQRSLFDLSREILLTSDAEAKANKALALANMWKSGKISTLFYPKECIKDIPEKPQRPNDCKTVPMSRVKQGSRAALIHSVVHAESYAIDLMCDIVVRFMDLGLPKEFYDDWIRIAGEESEHYSSWKIRLEELGSFYGSFPIHDGLWDSAQDTCNSLLARLAIVHMVHEARGLDVYPTAVKRFERNDDRISLKIIKKNHKEEITHVKAGVKWFKYLCQIQNKDPITEFHQIVKKYFKGSLKKPFNKEARDAADLTEEWYLPLSA